MDEETQGHIVVTLGSRERNYDFEDYDLTFDSSDSEVIEALSPVFEEEGIALDGLDEMYVIKRMEESGNIFVFPKSTAGK